MDDQRWSGSRLTGRSVESPISRRPIHVGAPTRRGSIREALPGQPDLGGRIGPRPSSSVTPSKPPEPRLMKTHGAVGTRTRARIRSEERGRRGRSLVLGTSLALPSTFQRGDCNDTSRHCRRVGWLISGLLGLPAFESCRRARPANRLRITRNSFAAGPSRGSGTDRAVPGGPRRFECGRLSVRASRRQGDKVAWPACRLQVLQQNTQPHPLGTVADGLSTPSVERRARSLVSRPADGAARQRGHEHSGNHARVRSRRRLVLRPARV